MVKEVKVRLAWPEERRRWDALMEEHHYLGFKQFAGRGLRYVAEWGAGGWRWWAGRGEPSSAVGTAGLAQGGAVSPAHLIGNNTRFLILPEGQGESTYWAAIYGGERGLGADLHRLELAETFVDPKRYQGTVYLASNWKRVGRTRGYGRSNGTWTERHGERKEMLLYPLREDARERLRDPEDRREWGCRGVAVDYGKGELQSLRRQLEGVEDFRRAQGRKHRMAAVVSICVLARLAGKVGPTETARFAKSLTQEELRVLGTWFDPKANCWVPPSLATIHRVLAHTGPDSLARQVQRWTAPRCREGTAFAGDGKRICGANRHAQGKRRWETVTLVEQFGASGSEFRRGGRGGCRGAGAAGGGRPARAHGHPRRPAHLPRHRAGWRAHGAHYLLTVKNNCPETCRMLETVDCSRPQATQGPEKGHGRIETRRIDTFCPPPGLLPFSHAKQAFRVTRKRYLIKEGVETVSFAYGITSAANRGHWSIENRLPPRHGLRRRPEPDSYPSWAGATISNAALAIVLHAGFANVPESIPPLSAAPGGRAGGTEPGERNRAGPAGPMPALHWACKARPGSRFQSPVMKLYQSHPFLDGDVRRTA